MPFTIKGYRVFISSPEGLEEERELFYDIIETYNKQHAIQRGFLFIPVGSQDVAPGTGRPQTIINERLCDCDCFVAMFWDRWGSDPGRDKKGEKYSSGTEEEYYKAGELLEDKNSPMCERVVLFKKLDERRLKDPGPQLKKVMEFKKKIRKEIYYREFEDKSEFGHVVTKLLAEWLFKFEYPSKPERKEATVVEKGDGIVS